ncbi:MAG TPA: pantoate--beta-alanine ligase [Amaricoccus sp.]|uniref:pantoate--beta-alanine ligase n=1 Tax=Amaricoccus sp. TaxID=1872485 RepID=UPI001E169889|nr:pantoate--beta-alanine ligase [Amaricoccus sp.]MCB1402951.1 pantoate--beta-alanine ligase [Paracoccaceae bacterium]MCC0067631.1 pantoate--beta-alanine ligase [Rhodovulum sp.]HPG21622.1 pantoate--beta-alanine ligase [Amaricoccus sp.]HRW15876.1 pantoate--beta-alanine ligase [Amaricoccus sp.]
MGIPIVRTLPALRSAVAGWKAAGQRVGVVPTMGALHAGHLSLARAARATSDRVIVTLFVNPRQFDNPDDLAAYPRTEDADAARLAPLGIDLLYAPDPDQIYPPGFATTVTVAGAGEGLEGAFRPGHFDGVATVVAKLLLQTGADRAFFGEKDFQQLRLVQRLVRDLDIPTEITGCATVREPDGLALSSRNARLAAAERAVAPALAAALRKAADAIAAGTPAEHAVATARAGILAAGFDAVEYLELRRDADLAPTARTDEPARLLAAAWLGGVRLIDNMPLRR